MAAAVFVLVMGAMDVRIEGQLTGCKRCRSFVCAARNTAVQSNARLRKRSLCAAADAAADQRVDLMRGQEACKGTVAAAVRVDYLAVPDLAVLLSVICCGDCAAFLRQRWQQSGPVPSHRR